MLTRSLFSCGLMAAFMATVTADEPKNKAPAADLLSAGLAKAQKETKRVFLVFGSPTCGWCKYFDKYHSNPEVSRVIGKHLVLVKVDIVDNAGGEAMYKKYGAERGVPAWVILDEASTVLGDSGDGKDNIGFPYEPNEIAGYFKAMKKACPRLTDGEIEILRAKLTETGPKREKAANKEPGK